MVSVPTVKDCLLVVVGHRACLVEWTLGVMGLACGVKVEGLKVYCSAWFSILLGTHNHAMAPCHWFSHWDRLQDTKGDVLIEPGLYFILPVKWHRDLCVVGHWLCIWDAIHEGSCWCSHVLNVLDL